MPQDESSTYDILRQALKNKPPGMTLLTPVKADEVIQWVSKKRHINPKWNNTWDELVILMNQAVKKR